MKNSKKAWIFFRRCIFILFIIFLINYFSVSTGYYESKINDKTVLTEEKIKEFERDVEKGEYIDIKDYTTEEYIDTSSPMSKASYKTSEIINDFVTDKTIKVFKFLGKLFG